MFERLQKNETADATATTTTFKANKLPDGDLLNKYKIISKESEQGMSLVYLLVMLIVISNPFYSNGTWWHFIVPCKMNTLLSLGDKFE